MTKYICQCCGEEKEDWPALAYNAPYFQVYPYRPCTGGHR